MATTLSATGAPVAESTTKQRADTVTRDQSSRYTLAVMLAGQHWSNSAELKALDLYCGQGYGTALLAHKLGLHVVGMEQDESLLATARQQFSQPLVEFAHTSGTPGLKTEAFDLITCFETLERVEQPNVLVDRLATSLKPGGLLFISAINEDILPLHANAGTFPEHRRHITDENLTTLATRSRRLELAARFGQSFYQVDAGRRVTGISSAATFLPQPNIVAPQILLHVYQKKASPAEGAQGAMHIADTAVVRDGGKGIEYPIGLAPRAELYANCTVGRYTYLNHGSAVYPNTSVGRFCSIGCEVHIGPPNHPTSFLSTHPFQFSSTYPAYAQFQHVPFVASARHTTVGHDVWIGTHAIILQGVTVGHGAIIGAGAIVTRDVPPYAIVAGNPARLLRYRFDEQTIKDLLELAWWDRDLAAIRTLPFDDIAACIRQLRSADSQAPNGPEPSNPAAG
jgi:acetyltransferase-like isoleucine patch superfamily enzyme/protein-L-isoaspartate O-methyltransferase